MLVRHRSVRHSRYSKAGRGYIGRLGREEEGEKDREEEVISGM